MQAKILPSWWPRVRPGLDAESMGLQRILIIGCSGAGKSTLARALAEKLALPLIHLDREYWLPGWKEPARAAWRAKVESLAATECWVMDGNYASTFDLRMPRADAVIVLDLPRITCLWGILTRPLRHWGRQRPDMGAGCIERYDWPFVLYVWRFKRDQMPKIMMAISQLRAETKIMFLHSRRAIRTCIASASGAGLA
jgi:adenylate kinase family enzyme